MTATKKMRRTKTAKMKLKKIRRLRKRLTPIPRMMKPTRRRMIALIQLMRKP